MAAPHATDHARAKSTVNLDSDEAAPDYITPPASPHRRCTHLSPERQGQLIGEFHALAALKSLGKHSVRALAEKYEIAYSSVNRMVKKCSFSVLNRFPRQFNATSSKP